MGRSWARTTFVLRKSGGAALTWLSRVAVSPVIGKRPLPDAGCAPSVWASALPLYNIEVCRVKVSPYLRKGIVPLPTVRQIPRSFSCETEPVQVAAASDVAAVADAFGRAIALGNPSITDGEDAAFPSWATVDRTGVKSWTTFARGALSWSLRTDPKTGEHRMHANVPLKRGGWTEDPVALFSLTPDTPVAEVARRAAEVVHNAAQLQANAQP